jgi:hypothetical protein
MESYMERASIIKPKISRSELINIKALMLEYNEIKEILVIDIKIEYIENIILEFLKNPEIMARYPKFRIVFMRKYKELKQSLKRYSVTSDIIEMMPIFLEIIKNRSDYVKHNYNLRSLKTNN